MKKRNLSHVQTTKIKFLCAVKVYTRLAQIPNDKIREKINVFSVNNRIKHHKQNWRDYIGRMKDKGIPNFILKYNWKEKVWIGHDLKDEIGATHLYF